VDLPGLPEPHNISQMLEKNATAGQDLCGNVNGGGKNAAPQPNQAQSSHLDYCET
jgi:hypothetical protein